MFVKKKNKKQKQKQNKDMCQLEIILCTITHDFNAAVGGILISQGRTLFVRSSKFSFHFPQFLLRFNENVLQWKICCHMYYRQCTCLLIGI